MSPPGQTLFHPGTYQLEIISAGLLSLIDKRLYEEGLAM